MTAPEPPSIWVQSELLPDGMYGVAIHYDDDSSRVFDRAAGLAYAAAIVQAAAQAEHDAAVIRQLTSTGVDLQAAAQTVAVLRANRPPLDDTVTAPLRLVPGVAAKTGRGFLRVDIGGRQVCQWDPIDAYDHASNMMIVLAAVDLDTAYRRHLVGFLGLDEGRAENVIADLGEHVRALASPADPS